MADIREYVTMREIAAILGISKCRVKQVAKEREIAGTEIGNMTVYHRSQVERFRRGKPRPKD